MNKRQKIVQQRFIDNEEAIIKRLKQVYNQSLKDIQQKTKALQEQINSIEGLLNIIDDADEIARLKSIQQSKIYQKQYQDALKKQVSSILDNMQVEEFKAVDEYLRLSYEDGFIGTMYDLQGQGIPLCFPLDQEAMVRAVQTDSKISQGLYARLGEDVATLKKKITAQVSRGISTGMSFTEIAQQLSAYTRIGYNNAVRIARTEGHRIQVQSGMDACYKAKEMGADVVKQWDSTLDKRTRASHQRVDGEIRELDEPFSNGLMFPGDSDGGASEVVNCRCALLQRARAALANEDNVIRRDNETGELIECKNYAEFKEKYLSSVERQSKINYSKIATTTDKEQFERYKKVLKENSPGTLEDFYNLKYNNKNEWETLKYQYRTVNRYEVDGSVSVNEILELDNVAYYTKKKGFDFSAYSGNTKQKLKKDLTNGGNAAAMHFDGKTYFSHSKFGVVGSLEHSLYIGEHPTVVLSQNRIFKVMALGDGVPRQFDTEAKFLEFVATRKKPTEKFTVTILSEKHICKSCQGVVQQFKEKFPNATVNVVSGKRGYNGSKEGLKTWKRRKKVK